MGFFMKMKNLFERKNVLSIEQFVEKTVLDKMKVSFSNFSSLELNQPQN